jgi:hypothetical protein
VNRAPADRPISRVTFPARYPYVPRGRLCEAGATSVVRGDLESAGPIGWTDAADAAAVARDLRATANEQAAFAPELRAAADRVESAARNGHGILGLIEFLSREADGMRVHLVDLDADDG